MRGFVGTIIVAVLFCSAGTVGAITCEECIDKRKEKQVAEKELREKADELSAAFKKKKFKGIRKINKRIAELRVKLRELKGSEDDCKKACKPDVVKGSECRKLRVKILDMDKEDADSEEKTEEIDRLYDKLRRCNRELSKLKSQAR
ncbi:hypothetical protein ACFL2Q_15025 [Thermodesulfobacteriota bacterium]